MGFDDLFEHDNKHRKYGHNHHYGYDNFYKSPHSYNHHSDIKHLLLLKLQSNPKLKVLLAIAAIIVLIIVVMVVILLFPLVVKLFDFISQNGIQGVIDVIWNGSKK